jgi:hypothetical protein
VKRDAVGVEAAPRGGRPVASPPSCPRQSPGHLRLTASELSEALQLGNEPKASSSAQATFTRGRMFHLGNWHAASATRRALAACLFVAQLLRGHAAPRPTCSATPRPLSDQKIRNASVRSTGLSRHGARLSVSVVASKGKVGGAPDATRLQHFSPSGASCMLRAVHRAMDNGLATLLLAATGAYFAPRCSCCRVVPDMLHPTLLDAV